MTKNWRELAWLVQFSVGRLEIRRRYSRRLWPVASPAARLYRRTLARRPRVVVVIGSVGKTTAMRAVSATLGLPVHPLALLNANSFAAASGAVLRIRPWQRHAVLEVGISAPGQMGIYAAEARPDVTVVTAIATDHWPSLGTLEGIRHEKAMMVRALSREGVAVLNGDDPNVRWMATQTRARVVLYGCAADADVRATDIEPDWPHGTRFLLHAAGESRPVAVRLVGRHMVNAALAAIAVGLVEGRTLDDAVQAVSGLEPTPGRMVPLSLPSGAVMLQDDAKGTLATFQAALETLATIPARRRIVVFGELRQPPAPEAVTYRELGARVAAVADRAIFVGSMFERYQVGTVAGGLAPERVERARDAHEAIALLRDELGPGDVVLVKGLWQQALARVGLALSGRPVLCRADPCPFKRMYCAACPFLERPFAGLPAS